MKLSEAMLLGSATCKMVAGDWNSCALGAAGNAVGIPQFDNILARALWIQDTWPWLRNISRVQEYKGAELTINYCEEIWTRFDNEVVGGAMTLEQLVDYVKSIEPQCGECNKFECTCVKAEVEQTEGVTVERSA